MTGEVTEKSTGVSKTVWRKVLYEDFGVADNYTDNTFLQELRTNINLSPISFKQSITGSLRITTYLSMAEQWLHAQAQEQGWAKATKLQDRSTAQGLIGIAVNKERNVAAMIELNCETDFVARNARFQDLVTTITNHCLTEVMKRQTDRHMFVS
ncbi:elongation factor Ts, mitochondrial-like isoform X2 [Artemia franciscana]|uniref:elongation factor Ts, mitochondrial-like isoform X2 n=1 Tax=Artemia franciscana TaxID=6661 RepID=UPI0032DBBADA